MTYTCHDAAFFATIGLQIPHHVNTGFKIIVSIKMAYNVTFENTSCDWSFITMIEMEGGSLKFFYM